VVRQLNKLTAAEAANAGPGWHSDGGGLFLRADDQGRKRWIFRFSFLGKKKELGLGSANAVALANARAQAKRYREMVAQGRDPLAERRHAVAVAAASKTFAEVAAVVIERDKKSWGASSHEAWERSLFDHAKRLGPMDINAIDIEHIVEALQPLWDRGAHASARSTLQRIETVLATAIARKWRKTANVAAWKVFKHVAPKRPGGHDEDRRHAMVSWEDAPAVVEKIRAVDTIAARALTLAVLTGARISEATGATWGEIDLDRKLWTIPGPRMKMRKPHVVPLSRQAIELLDELLKVRTGDNVFPSPAVGSKPISRVQPWRVAQAATGGAATTHGFRSTFRSWCAAHGVEREVAEAAIAHAISGVEGIYQRDCLVGRRRPVMQAWADYVIRLVLLQQIEARLAQATCLGGPIEVANDLGARHHASPLIRAISA
jgi:integrase